jgi:serine/threonine-protein kinase
MGAAIVSRPGEHTSALRSIANALSLEVSRLELLRATAGLAMSVVMMVVGASVLGRGSVAVGAVGMAAGFVAFSWFLFVRRLLRQRRFRPALGWVTVAMENSFPWLFYAALGFLGQPAAAHHDWGPLLLYCGVLVVGVLRLSPVYSMVMGLVATVLYQLVTWLVLVPIHVARAGAVDEFTVRGEITRVLMILGAAAMVAWVTHGLRGAVGGVVRSIRAADLFGKYRLESELAAGGMGVVWRATYCPEGGFERPAAIKLVHTHLMDDPGFVDAFRREAALGARLVHHNIVQVFDFGIVDDRYFLAMEFVDGPTLREVMVRAAKADLKIPPAVAGAITRAILAGLSYAHAEAKDTDGAVLRVIHRDLAPSNILMSKGGAVKLTDFGIARALRDNVADETQTVAGHVDHMAPEQATAQPLDERTDLFCVGILLWELLCGRPLFLRGNQPATLLAITMGEIPLPSEEDPTLAAWDPLLRRALDRDPAGRFTSAAQMASAVGAVVGDVGDETVARFVAPLMGFSGPALRGSAVDPDATLITRSNR